MDHRVSRGHQKLVQQSHYHIRFNLKMAEGLVHPSRETFQPGSVIRLIPLPLFPGSRNIAQALGLDSPLDSSSYISHVEFFFGNFSSWIFLVKKEKEIAMQMLLKTFIFKSRLFFTFYIPSDGAVIYYYANYSKVCVFAKMLFWLRQRNCLNFLNPRFQASK